MVNFEVLWDGLHQYKIHVLGSGSAFVSVSIPQYVKGFSLLYRPSAVNPVCCDEADYNSEPHLCAPTIIHLVNLQSRPTLVITYSVCYKKVVHLPTESTNPGECLLSFRLTFLFSAFFCTVGCHCLHSCAQ